MDPCKTVTTPSAVEACFREKQDFYAPQNETYFVIMRHGENLSNVQKTLDGRTLNLPLTEKGFEQGRRLGGTLKHKISQFDLIITTSMQRTDQTAQAVLQAFDSIPPKIVDDRYLERYVGKYEGMFQTAYEENSRKEKEASASSTLTFQEKMEFVPEEGIESVSEVWKRASEALMQKSLNLKDGSSLKLKGKVVGVVTHSGTIRAIYWYLTQKLGFFIPYANFKPDNGAYLILSRNKEELKLLETGDIRIIPQEEL